jgi:hypothetical protein
MRFKVPLKPDRLLASMMILERASASGCPFFFVRAIEFEGLVFEWLEK